MISIVRIDPPSFLDASTKSNLTALFIAKGDDVWNHSTIRSALLSMSHDKCAYCETKINEESKYLEVDHFLGKKQYPNHVVDWYNLLPSCKRCNTSKGAHDVLHEGMIIDPSLVDPKKHLKMINYRIYGRDDIGTRTQQEIGLNDSKRLVFSRLAVGEAVSNALIQIKDDLMDYNNGSTSTRRKNKIIRGCLNVLLETLPDTAYSATAATVIETSPDYVWIKQQVHKLGWWNESLDDLDQNMRRISLS